MHRVPLAQREYLDVRVVGKTPRPAETTTRHCQPGGEGHTFGADSESEFLGLQLWASTPVASPAALRHHPRQEPRALTRMRGSVRGDWRKPVPYRDVMGVIKQNLGCDFDRLHELVNQHMTLRQFLGHADIWDKERYHYQTLVD